MTDLEQRVDHETSGLDKLPILQLPARSPLAVRFDVPEPELPRGTHPAPPFTASPKDSPDRIETGGTGDQVDWDLVDDLRRLAAERLTSVLRDEPAGSARQHELGRGVIADLLRERVRDSMVAGVDRPLTLIQQQQAAKAVEDALFGAGRMQPLLDRDEIENIEMFGFDNVVSEDVNGVLANEAPAARSDADLVDALAFLASRQDNERAFSEARPSLNLSLGGDARLAAVAFVTPRPVVVIRRHRLKQVTLTDLVSKGTLSDGLAGFLRAAVKANLSLVVAGHQGAGKTTLVRALGECIPVREKIGTFETDRELFLDQLPDRDTGRVVAFEARPGTGEFLPNGRMAGEVTLSELMHLAKRFNLDREIVGEVRGEEIIPMIHAMQSGAGSMSTTHGRSARQAFSKLITCAMEANSAFTQTTAARALAETIDLVVYLRREDIDSRRHRYVTEVITPGWVMDGASGHVDFTDIYLPGSDGRATPHTIADDMDHLLARHGFDSIGFHQEAASHLRDGGHR